MRGRKYSPPQQASNYNKPGKDGEYYLEIPLREETVFIELFQFNETNFLVKTKDSYCSLTEACEDWQDENKKTSERKYKKFLMEKQTNVNS